mmetsp:Transcript_21700/g.70087  ORF Transcript_21700/g.70087 Transcript_21700/m.70087 type:complete len:244 (-) Transcript_21700:125-856(-)
MAGPRRPSTGWRGRSVRRRPACGWGALIEHLVADLAQGAVEDPVGKHVKRHDEQRDGDEPEGGGQPARLQQLRAGGLRLERDQEHDKPVDAKGGEDHRCEHLPRKCVDSAERPAGESVVAASRAALPPLVDSIGHDVRDGAHVAEVDNLHRNEGTECLANLVEVTCIAQRRVSVDVDDAFLRSDFLRLIDVAEALQQVASDEQGTACSHLAQEHRSDLLSGCAARQEQALHALNRLRQHACRR